MKKNIVLFTGGVMVLVLFFLLPKNKSWFTERITGYWNDFRQQKNHLNIEERKRIRWGTAYTVSTKIAGLLRSQTNDENALLLVPPTAYFTAAKIDYHVPEPAVFYYYTGVKTTWANSPMALQATRMVTAVGGEFKVVSVTDKKALADSLQKWKNYPVEL